MTPPQATVPATTPCRICGKPTRHRFAGYATDDAVENGVRPRAFYRTCDVCRLLVLVLGDCWDAEGLVRASVTVWFRKIPDPDRLDRDDAVAHGYAEVWRLYRSWLPTRLVFRSYASYWLPRRLDRWLLDTTGDADGQRRAEPKSHAWSVSESYDALAEHSYGTADATWNGGWRAYDEPAADEPHRRQRDRLELALAGSGRDSYDGLGMDIGGVLHG